MTDPGITKQMMFNALTHRFKGALAAMLIAFLLAYPTLSVAQGANVVTQITKNSFENTITSLKKGITANKLVIIKEVPITQMLSMVGVKSEKTLGLEIFHPRYGKAIYKKDKNALLEVPLRILVRDEGGEVSIQYRKPSATFSGYSGLADVAAELDGVFERIVDSAM
ncbi:MAG: DUF302 domain-containing protein [Gammaproteobacteria bacterium]